MNFEIIIYLYKVRCWPVYIFLSILHNYIQYRSATNQWSWYSPCGHSDLAWFHFLVLDGWEVWCNKEVVCNIVQTHSIIFKFIQTILFHFQSTSHYTSGQWYQNKTECLEQVFNQTIKSTIGGTYREFISANPIWHTHQLHQEGKGSIVIIINHPIFVAVQASTTSIHPKKKCVACILWNANFNATCEARETVKELLIFS